ncbi:hypothetical protein RCL_jg24295.t1 [Rhizophagus clarus]|uniref:Uncharacterized protein n=1 Tax=Rhizophagus clarus TaxID=94130 RepID=A0A8H3MGC0_9GLOM|nr:hypothetical protein RCL_jg24295.t1 [Rhizophagus clarus]
MSKKIFDLTKPIEEEFFGKEFDSKLYQQTASSFNTSPYLLALIVQVALRLIFHAFKTAEYKIVLYWQNEIAQLCNTNSKNKDNLKQPKIVIDESTS